MISDSVTVGAGDSASQWLVRHIAEGLLISSLSGEKKRMDEDERTAPVASKGGEFHCPRVEAHWQGAWGQLPHYVAQSM